MQKYIIHKIGFCSTCLPLPSSSLLRSPFWNNTFDICMYGSSAVCVWYVLFCIGLFPLSFSMTLFTIGEPHYLHTCLIECQSLMTFELSRIIFSSAPDFLHISKENVKKSNHCAQKLERKENKKHSMQNRMSVEPYSHCTHSHTLIIVVVAIAAEYFHLVCASALLLALFIFDICRIWWKYRLWWHVCYFYDSFNFLFLHCACACCCCCCFDSGPKPIEMTAQENPSFFFLQATKLKRNNEFECVCVCAPVSSVMSEMSVAMQALSHY